MTLPSDDAIAGFVAGAAASAVLHPFDFVKVRLQVHDGMLPRDLLGTSPQSALKFVQKNARVNGCLHFYQGVRYNVLAASLTWSSYFVLYRRMKQVLCEHLPHRNLAIFMASSLSGAICTLAMNPLWVLKTRAILAPTRDDAALSKLLSQMKSGGAGAFYSGLGPGLLASVHGGIHFMIYENLRHLRPLDTGAAQPGDLEVAIYSFASKLAAIFLTYPLQVLRSRLQDVRGDTMGNPYNKGLLEAVHRIYSREAIRGFYKGIFTSLFKIVPNSMITLVVYEKTMRLLAGNNNI